MPCIINFMCFQKLVAVTFFQTISNFQEEKKNNFRKKLNCQAFVFCCACILEPGDILQELQYVDVLQNCNISNINFICRCNSVTKKNLCTSKTISRTSSTLRVLCFYMTILSLPSSVRNCKSFISL